MFEPVVNEWRLYRRSESVTSAPDFPAHHTGARADESAAVLPSRPYPEKLRAVTEQLL